jgi:starch phosphorylase
MAARCKPDDLIAYFCAEFGFHESLPIYSGGLGILAGDHCKAPATCACPSSPSACSTARATSSQTSTADGRQQRIYGDSISTTCRSPVLNADGRKCWSRRLPRPHRPGQALGGPVGHVRLYLLDTWLPQKQRGRPRNHPPTLRRRPRTRIEQEILLGVGGVRALAALG